MNAKAEKKMKRVTEVFAANTDDFNNKQLFAAYYFLMSDERKKKIDRCRFDKDKKLSLGIEALLMYAVLKRGFKWDVREFKTGIYENGKMYFVNHPEIKFNLSHSGNAVMCAVSDYEVGCDIEQTGRDFKDIANRFFFNDEIKLIENAPDEKSARDYFFRLWTLKESFMKVTGLGFKLPLNEFGILPGKKISVLQSDKCKELTGKNDGDYSFFEFNYSDDYRCAMSIEDAGASAPEFNTVNFTEIYNDYFSK